MSYLPLYVSLFFCITVIITLLLFVNSIRNSFYENTKKKAKYVFFALIIWLIFQAIVALLGNYNDNINSFPTRIILIGFIPIILLIFIVFLTRQGRLFIDTLPLKNITFVNLVRIPVELVLYWLFLNKNIPILMTFEGRNFDVIAGITSVFILYFGFGKIKISLNVILIWNFICLALLINIVFNAILSTPSSIQQFGFEQPNIAILHFPFIWLPTFIVPVILFGHLVSIRQIIKFISIKL